MAPPLPPKHRRPGRPDRARSDAEAGARRPTRPNWRSGRDAFGTGTPSGIQEALVDLRLRRLRRRRQGRQHPTHHGRDGCAPVPDHARSPRRPKRSARSPTSGVSGGTYRAAAASPSSTAPGTAACWSSASRVSAPRPTGCAPTPRSTTSSRSLPRPAPSSSSSGCRSADEEQLKRFKEREKIEFKRFKITEEDWRNREKWDAYHARRLRHGRPHQHRHRAVDAGRGQRQELRAGEDSARPSASGWKRR